MNPRGCAVIRFVVVFVVGTKKAVAMKVGSGALATALCLGTTAAFAPSAFTRSARSSVGQTGRLAMTFDPSAFHDLPYHVETIRDAFASSVLISDLDTIVDVSQASGAIATSAVENVAVAAGTAVAPAASEAAAAGSGNGWFGFLEGPIENLLQIIHGVFVSVGLPGAWGISIIAMTAFIKLLTYPLTKQQLESTSRMQVSPSSKSCLKSGFFVNTCSLQNHDMYICYCFSVAASATANQGAPSQVCIKSRGDE